MATLRNSSTAELQAKFVKATRLATDAILMAIGYVGGVIAIAWLGVWWPGLVVVLAVFLYWSLRSYFVFRVAHTREKAWRIDYDKLMKEVLDGDEPS